jgi:hypothetical protein
LPTSATSDSASEPDATDPSGSDGLSEERRNVTRLIRWVSMFVAWPSLTIALAFLVVTGPSEHWLHIFGLLPLGLAALVAFAMAPGLAERLVR